MSAMGSEATPLCTLPLPPLPCTHQLPRQLLWLFTTITHQQLLPIPHLLLPILLLLFPPQPTTMSPSLTPPMPSPMELEAAQTVRLSRRDHPLQLRVHRLRPRDEQQLQRSRVRRRDWGAKWILLCLPARLTDPARGVHHGRGRLRRHCHLRGHGRLPRHCLSFGQG